MAAATAPAAGHEIQNQGAVSYVDADGIPQQTSTNLVVLTVQQVYSATLDEDRTAFSAPGTTVLFYHRLRNTGNGTEQFVPGLSDVITGGDDLNFDSVTVVNDLNQNGIADSGEPIVASLNDSGVIVLEAGKTADLIVAGDISASATAGTQLGVTLTVQGKQGTGAAVVGSVIDVTAGKGLDALDDTNEDLVTVSDDAVLTVTKTSSYNDNGTATTNDDQISYTVRITNASAQTARDVIITDFIPTNTTFLSVDATNGDYLSAAGDDGANGSDGSVPAFVAGPDRIEGEIDVLAASDFVDFTFTVYLKASVAADTVISNTAQADGDLDNDNLSDEVEVLSNSVLDVVPAFVGLTLTDTGVDAGATVNDGGDDDGGDLRAVQQFVKVGGGEVGLRIGLQALVKFGIDIA